MLSVYPARILAEDEGYNCEWSTELTVSQALEEYIKAWCILNVISKAYSLGDENAFVFNMSVGYDLKGIKSKKIDDFIESLKDVSKTETFSECKEFLKKYFPEYSEYIDNISPKICTSVTLSTLHGCPPDEIERIATYLLTQKKLNTFVKCNPTILGYKSAREILDSMGYDYIAFDDHHFKEDLQYDDAVLMFSRLMKLADENSLFFGLKLSNTFPVDVKAKELPSEEMYMSGRALFPLTVEMANRLSKEFDGKINISFSGGADYFNIDKLFDIGIMPITVATTVLKPGGYLRLHQLAEKLQNCDYTKKSKIDTQKLSQLSLSCRNDVHHTKSIKPLKSRKSDKTVPLFDCYTAPCIGGCPICQDIPEYIRLCKKELYKEALDVIIQKNPLPFITGTICSHNCMTKCTRNFYESPVKIRDTKLLAAKRGYDEFIKELSPKPLDKTKKVAIIGAGAAGLAAAYFTAMAGIKTIVFEKEAKAGGIVRNVIPSFRISDESIEKDINLIEKSGAKILTSTKAPNVEKLKQEGYTHILFAVGAYKAQKNILGPQAINVIDFLKDLKAENKIKLGKKAVVIGGGNTAMDAARAAKRVSGVESVTIVYRRTKKYMPADEEELLLAMKDGVEFEELLSPISYENKVLKCSVMKLGEIDESGRRKAIDTGKIREIKADSVITAIGEKVDTYIFTENAITCDEKGRVPFKTNIEGVYNAGDSMRGPCTVVECIADARRFADIVIGKKQSTSIDLEAFTTPVDARKNKGILCDSTDEVSEGERCLSCNTVCENCVDVCPNRANTVIVMKDMRREILHIDRLCNECGNCNSFCPYNSAPYKDKLTLFSDIDSFNDSTNKGFVILDNDKVLVRVETEKEYSLSKPNDLDKNIEMLILTILSDYNYLLN